MGTFYDEWLATGERIQADLRRSGAVARDRDIPWVRTRQDAKVKLMVANELGYATMGSNVLKGDIPAGWHTGKHVHGEESMHILAGEGFSVIDGQRFDWHTGTTIQIPYRAEHQHFNTGSEPAQYISGMVFDLETFVRLAGLVQLEDCGQNDPQVLASFPAQTSEYYPNGQRAIIHLEDAPSDASFEPQGNNPAVVNQHHFTQNLSVPANGFRETSVNVTHLREEPPYHHSGRHKHLEAVVYAIEGDGYTEMMGEKHVWEAGDVLYVPPAMWEHEHYNDSPRKIRQLRIQFGIRFWFHEIWPPYRTTRIYDDQGRPIEAGAIERHRERE
jgi:gentisate 1,2-dioxygenase